MKTILKRLIPLSIRQDIRHLITPNKNKCSLEKLEKSLAKKYEVIMGHPLDLSSPTKFTEKIQWYKLYYNHPELARCVDKVEFKNYVKENLGDEGYTARLLDVWTSPEQVSFDKLPNSFVVKSNAQSDGNYIAIIKDKKNADLDALEKEIKNNWFNPMNLLINSFCRAYYNVKPKVFVEEYLEQFAGQLVDYKLFCFNGRPEFFYAASEHFINGKKTDSSLISLYSLDWNRIDVYYGSHQPFYDAPCPKHKEEMLDIAQKLSAKFPFVRVDFFDTDEKLYLAELTFYPGGGFIKFEPPTFNEKLGSYFVIK